MNLDVTIEEICTPQRLEVPFAEIWKKISESDPKKVWTLIHRLSYYEFLKTPYWAVVAIHVKKREKHVCMCCGRGGLLTVRHKTRDIIGREHLNMDQLTCFCDKCFEKLR